MTIMFRAAALFIFGTVVAQAATGYNLQTRFAIEGTDGWDYITIDSAARVSISHTAFA